MKQQVATGGEAGYAKLKSGAWGLRGRHLAPGQLVTVVKRDGSRKQETVGKVVWVGGDGTCLAEIAGGAGSTSQATASNGSGQRAHRPGHCVKCGERCNPRYRVCLDCREGGGRYMGGQSYTDSRGNFVLGEDD